MGYSVETKKEIWNDDSGTRIEIGPDRDGLHLWEVRQYDADNKRTGTMTFTTEELGLMARAILHLLDLEE